MWVKSFALTVWNVIDPVYYACTRLKCIAHENSSAFRVRLTTYRGKNVRLSDGTVIKRGDILLKIHLHNVILLQNMNSIKSEITKGKFLYNLIKNSLPDLAVYVRNHPKHAEIKGIIGITMLNRGGGRLGFEMVPITNVVYKWIKLLSMMPLCFFSANHPLQNFKKTPTYLFMSKNMIMNKYGSKSLANFHSDKEIR